jgi:Domain of unknown function (DUF5060)
MSASKFKTRNSLLMTCLTALLTVFLDSPTAGKVPQWSVHELSFTAGGKYTNPYTEVTLKAVFTGPGGVKQTIKGFWDGESTFKVRFTPIIVGA